MLVLPNGQVLFTDGVSDQVWVYSENLPTPASAKPIISSITSDGAGTYVLSGTGLNGPSEGATFGDDAQMNENYPIVWLQNSAGQVFYAATGGWSYTGVGEGTADTVDFTLPSTLPNGTYTLFESGAGVGPAATPLKPALQSEATSGSLSSTPTNQAAQATPTPKRITESVLHTMSDAQPAIEQTSNDMVSQNSDTSTNDDLRLIDAAFSIGIE